MSPSLLSLRTPSTARRSPLDRLAAKPGTEGRVAHQGTRAFGRSALLGVIAALHVGLFVGLANEHATMPQPLEPSMQVDLLETPTADASTPAVRQPPVKVALQTRPAPARSAPVTPAPTRTTDAAPASPVSNSDPLPTQPSSPQIASPGESKMPSATASPLEASPARFDADYLRNPTPPYPPLSRRSGEEGKVILRVQVNALGGAENVEIKSSSGVTRLDEAALNTVRKWKFIPAKRGDQAIASSVFVPIVFKLEQ